MMFLKQEHTVILTNRQFKNSVYRIASYDGEDDVLVPLSLLPELKKLPDNFLSFPKAADEV
jgi:hypothetical protein